MTRRILPLLKSHGNLLPFAIALLVCNLPAFGQTVAMAQPAQDIEGTWQGTLPVGQEMRIVLKITKTGSGAPRGVFYSIDTDLGSEGRATTSMTLQGSAFEFAIVPIDGSYQGKLSADGTSIAGTWTQYKQSHALNLLRATADTAWAIPEADKPMPVDASPEFEVATIKPSDMTSQKYDGFKNHGRRVYADKETFDDIITVAFGIHKKQDVGAPAWFATDYYDIDGFPDLAGTPNLQQMQGMYRNLLADRLRLTFHHETRELSVYAITVENKGPKLTKSLGDPNGQCDSNGVSGVEGVRAVRFTNTSMAEFALIMQLYGLERPVVDQTGLSGKFDFLLRWTLDEPQTNDPSAPPGLFTAIQEQLGLKLQLAKAPVDVIVIDHVEKPSDN